MRIDPEILCIADMSADATNHTMHTKVGHLLDDRIEDVKPRSGEDLATLCAINILASGHPFTVLRKHGTLRVTPIGGSADDEIHYSFTCKLFGPTIGINAAITHRGVKSRHQGVVFSSEDFLKDFVHTALSIGLVYPWCNVDATMLPVMTHTVIPLLHDKFPGLDVNKVVRHCIEYKQRTYGSEIARLQGLQAQLAASEDRWFKEVRL